MPAIVPSSRIPQQSQTPPTPGPDGFQSPEQTNQVPNVPIQQIADNTIAHPGQSVADFINDAHAAGYGSIDPNIIATVAYHNGNTAQSKLALAVIKQAQAMPNKTAQYLYEQSAVDPVQSLGKVIHDHLQNTGIQVVNAEPTSQLQQQIINAGYAFPGAKADGVWNADWNNASYNWGTGQQAKLGVGGFSAQGVLNTTMGEGWLNHAIALVRGVAEAIPAGVIKGLASGLKGTSDVMTGIGSLLGNKTSMDAAQQDSLGIAHAMDSIGRITDNEKKIGTQAYIDTPFGTQDLMNIANAALSISAAGTLRKLGVSTLAGVKEGIAAGTEAGAKNAATALVKDIGPQAPKGILNTIMNTAFPETATGNRLAFTRWLHNVPAAQGLVNGLDKVAEGTMNTYKTARSIAATPYRLPIFGILGKAATDTSIAGMKLGIQGHTENWLGDPNAPQAFALDHLTPIAGLAGQALNTLQLGAHGPSYDSAGLPSQQIADVAQSVHESFADAANSTGVLSGFERGANASVLKQMDELAKAGLNPDLRLKQISSKFMDLAARHAAQSEVEDKVQAGIIDPTNADQMLRFRQNAQSVIRNDPAKLKDAIESYYAKPMAWETDLQKEISLSKEDPTAWMNQGNVSYTKAQELFKSQLLHRLGDLQTPETGVAPEDTSWMSQGLNDVPAEPAPAYEGGTPLFHGASTNMEGKIDDNVFRESDRNLFGDGFYTTDSRSVAKGYTKKGGNTEPTVHSVKWNGKGTPKLINLEEVASPELRKIFSSLNTEDGYIDYSTLDAALQDPKSKGTDLYRALRTDLRNNGSEDQAAEDFQHITAQLQDAGYDAMTHKGNIRGKGSDHNVTIWLKPGDLSVTKLNDVPDGVMTPEQVIASAKEAQSPIAQNQLIQIQKLMKTNGITERDARLKFMTNFLQRDVKSTNDLTNGEAGRLIKKLTPVTHSMNDARVASLKNEPISSKFGISHKDALLAQDVQRKAMGYAQELQDAKPGYIAPATLDELEQSSNGMEFGANSEPAQLPATFNPKTATTAENTLRGKVMETLKNELGRSPRDLDYVPTQDLIKLVSEHSHWLASEVGVPAELQHVADALDKLGYKLNYGTDVGLQWTDPLLPKEMLGSPRNLAQKGIDRLGLNLAKVEPKYLAQAKTTMAQSTMQETIDKIKQENNTLPDWATGSRLMMAAQDIIRPSVGPLSSFYLDMAAAPVVGKAITLRPALGSAWGDEIKALMHTTQTNLDGTTTTIETRRDALSFIEKKLAASNTPQTWLKKDWMKAMTSKGDDRGMITNNKGFETHAISMSEKEANQLWFAMHKGFDKTPAYIAGINPFSKLANSTFGLANIPLEINGNRILDLTRKLQPALIQARYSVSPLQSWLRVAKSAIKGVNENMPLSANPYASLAELGANVEKAAYDLTDKAYGVDKNANDVAAEFSAAEFAGHKDLSNVFNPRATLARTVHYVAQNMMNEKYAEAALNPFPDKLKLKIETPKEGVVETKPIYDQFDKKTEIKTQSNDNYKVSFANKETGKEAARILWNKDTGEIKSVFVDPAFRRQGLAKSLFANATKIANEKGIQEPVHSTLLSEEGSAWKKALDQSELHGITPSDYPELKSRVDAINNYGNRTAAEKSVNAFFFPFSFEKTVVRELGGALLDSPSLRMMAAAAVLAYNSTDGQTSKKWMEDNLPLFKEAEKFNPFYHGTGLGQFGGINKTPFSVAEHLLYGGKPTPKNPLDGLTAADKLELFVKMLMPKPVTTKNSAVAALALVPALKDLSTNILGYNPGSSGPQGLSQSALMTTYHTLKWEAGSEISKIVKDHRFTGPSNTDNWASQGHLPYQVQQNQAWQLRSQIISAYSSALAANQHGGNFAFPEGFPPAFAGTQRITTGNINQLVHEVYPAFDPAKIYASIGAKLTAVADQRAEILQKSPDLIDYYNQFIKYSDEVQGFIAKDSLLPTFDSSKLVEPMNYLRNLAATLSANDPTFPAFYSKYYATKYGALKGL